MLLLKLIGESLFDQDQPWRLSTPFRVRAPCRPARKKGIIITACAVPQLPCGTASPGPLREDSRVFAPGTVTKPLSNFSCRVGNIRLPDPLLNDTGAPPGTRVLSYRDLKALNPYPYKRYDRIIEMRLTGNMQRYFWSINGRKFSEAEPIVLRYGERVRCFINETMMNHPMHIHGTWFLPEVGNGARNPKKHTVNIKPGATLDVDVPADAEGPWAFHCHQLYHMETGMMRKIEVVRQTASVR